MVYRWVGAECGLRKTEKIFSANNEQGTRIFTLGLHYSWTNQKVQLQLVIFFQSFSGNHFSPRFMVPCSLLSENIISVFRSPHLPLDTPFWTRGFPLVMRSRKAGFPFATHAWKREPCLQRYVSIMTRTKNFLSQFFSKFFSKPLFSTFYGTLFIISRKYFFRFFEVRTYPSIPLAGLIKKSSFSWTNQKSPAVAGLFY